MAPLHYSGVTLQLQLYANQFDLQLLFLLALFIDATLLLIRMTLLFIALQQQLLHKRA